MSERVLLVEDKNETTTILTLNRPLRRNALNLELMQQLCETIPALTQDGRRRLVVLRGAGKVFCAGLDLHEAADSSVAEESAEWVARTFETLSSTSLVTIAAAHGAAYAGGAGLLAACDFAVAADDLRICFPEVRRGLIPALVSAVLNKRIQPAALRELMLMGEPIDATTALELGLVQRVVAVEDLMHETDRMAQSILEGAPEAVRQTKKLLREMQQSSATEGFQQALEFHIEARNSDEAREGIAAYREKRKPKW